MDLTTFLELVFSIRFEIIPLGKGWLSLGELCSAPVVKKVINTSVDQ